MGRGERGGRFGAGGSWKLDGDLFAVVWSSRVTAANKAVLYGRCAGFNYGVWAV
jgi:hypothetical protein